MQQLAQLTLGLSLRDEATFANFYPGKNSEIVNELKNTASGLNEKIIYLCNAGSFGCSHLLQATCHEAYLHKISSVYLPLRQLISFSPEILHGLESLSIVCIDDMQIIAGKKDWEEALFHLFNRIKDLKGSIVMSANNLPKAIPFLLPDLMSRLAWGVVFQLHTLSDEEKIKALMMRANRRGIHLSDEVAKYILTHCPRHMATLFAALDALDKASLAAQKRLTIPFVKTILQI